MKRIYMVIVSVGILLLAGLLAACNSESDPSVSVEDYWARPGFEGDNAAAYMEIRNDGDEDIALIAASSDIAETIELHQTRMEEPEDHDDNDHDDHADDHHQDDHADDHHADDHADDNDQGHGHGHGMMIMEEVASIVAPAGSSVLLEPGGYHVMFMGLTRDLEPGDTFELTLEFDEIDDQTIEVTVEER